jgi:hypothetical protein
MVELVPVRSSAGGAADRRRRIRRGTGAGAVRVAVITAVSGRHRHLQVQRQALARSGHPVAAHVVVAMSDPGAVSESVAGPAPAVVAVHVPVRDEQLPLALARNAGAEAALEAGAELLVFLDVDCIPGRGTLGRYVQVARRGAPRLLCGPVAYLPPVPTAGYDLDRLPELARAHPARPVPAEDAILPADDSRLFWSLSFAVRPDVWRRVGGFCELYRGYGGEDTDFGQQAAAAGIGIDWIGGAWAYHQFHPISDPPLEHLDDIVRNAGVFHRRWGWWPMQGWLEAFEQRGLVHYDAASGWRRTRSAGP